MKASRIRRAPHRQLLVALMFTVSPIAFFPMQAEAQDQSAASAGAGVDTVVVTAQKRPENIQDVPMSVSAFSGRMLEQQNVSTVADLSRFVPSLSINISNNNRNSSIIIRNVGTSGTNPGTDQDVGVFVDGVRVPVTAVEVDVFEAWLGDILNELFETS